MSAASSLLPTQKPHRWTTLTGRDHSFIKVETRPKVPTKSCSVENTPEISGPAKNDSDSDRSQTYLTSLSRFLLGVRRSNALYYARPTTTCFLLKIISQNYLWQSQNYKKKKKL